ncbi:hypothetical protein [Streptomyces albus]|uniref:hypothetical protein n=1 Tax=Streptomyces albus TaxID=1888 RepID=UPI0024E06EB4|nr:hypothetical protein [Streptomyces albus]GHJ24433.1 hypothetical protein TPA0909_60470 [Streptomyces albus]
MATTPEIRDQHIADLRAALQRAVALICYSAGREAPTDPEQSEELLRAADGMREILARTAP